MKVVRTIQFRKQLLPTAVIEQILALPPEEQAKVVEFLAELKSANHVNTMKAETFEDSAKRVFDRHAELMRKLSQ